MHGTNPRKMRVLGIAGAGYTRGLAYTIDLPCKILFCLFIKCQSAQAASTPPPLGYTPPEGPALPVSIRPLFPLLSCSLAELLLSHQSQSSRSHFSDQALIIFKVFRFSRPFLILPRCSSQTLVPSSLSHSELSPCAHHQPGASALQIQQGKVAERLVAWSCWENRQHNQVIRA